MSALNQGKDTEETLTHGVNSPTRAYNLMWIVSRDFPVSTKQPFWRPIPHTTITNMYGIAERNPDVDVNLWIDSRRMTDAQMDWLEIIVEESVSDNITLHDFRDVFEYKNHPLYNQSNYSPEPHFHKNSLIWRQVDAARILACLRSPHDQVFYSDTDVANLVVNSDEVQEQIKKHGVILAGGISEKTGRPWYENALFGFDGRKRKFFRQLYERTLRDAIQRRENGYRSYVSLITSELEGSEGIDPQDIVFQAVHDNGRMLCGPKVKLTQYLPPKIERSAFEKYT